MYNTVLCIKRISCIINKFVNFLLLLTILILRMGFTVLEKDAMTKMLRKSDEIAVLRKQDIPDIIYQFLRIKGLLNQVRDYGRFPSKWRHKITAAENIEIVKLYNAEFNPIDVLEDLGDTLSPPYRIQMDCSMILGHPTGKSKHFWYLLYKYKYFKDEMQFVWPQRNLAINRVKNINTDEDFYNLLSEMKSMNRFELLKTVAENHQNQCAFQKSSYFPVCLLTFAFYISKNGFNFE